MTLVVGAEREGLPDAVLAECDEVCHIPIALGVAERGHGRDGGNVRGEQMIDRIQQIQDAAADAVARAGLLRRARAPPHRVPRAQGRAAAAAARRRRAAAGGARQGRQGRQPGARGDRGADRPPPRGGRPRGARRAARRRRRRRHAPGLARPAGRAPAPADPHAPRARGHLRRPRLPRRRGAGGRHRRLQLRRPQPRHHAPGAAVVGHVLRRRRHRAAHAHLADAGALDDGPAAAALHRHPGRLLPARQRRHAHPAVPPGRGPGGRRGHHAGRPQGHAAGVRARHLRRRARGALPPALLPVHRAERRARRRLLQLQRRLPARRLALPALQGRGLDRAARRRRGRPQRVRVRARVRLRPRAPPGLRLGHGDRADRGAEVRGAGHPAAVRQRPAGSWSSSADAAPDALAQRLLRPRAGRRRARGAPDHDRDLRRARVRARRDRARELRRRPGAERPSSIPTPTG